MTDFGISDFDALSGGSTLTRAVSRRFSPLRVAEAVTSLFWLSNLLRRLDILDRGRLGVLDTFRENLKDLRELSK